MQPIRSRPDGEATGARTIAMRALGRTVYRRLEWLEQELGQDPPRIDARVPLETGFLDAAAADELVAFHPSLARADVQRRVGRGDRCFASRYEGDLAAVSWVATGSARIDYLELSVALPPGTFYHYDRFTAPALRGLRIAPATGSRLCRVLAAEGLTTMVAAVLRENRPAMRNALGFGMHRTATIGWVGIGPLRRTFRRPRA